jgi:hypothetical protein
MSSLARTVVSATESKRAHYDSTAKEAPSVARPVAAPATPIRTGTVPEGPTISK